jgi:hypothetical protein
MATTCTIREQYGTSPGTSQANVSNLNVGDESNYEIVVADHPIKVTEHSYEKWFVMYFTSAGSETVSNFKTWISGGSLETYADLKTNCNESSMADESYATPVKTVSSIAVEDYAESEPSGQNISVGGSLSGSISSYPNETDYIVMQYQTASGHALGAISQLTLTFQWDEQ